MKSRILKHLTGIVVCPTCSAGIQSETFSGRVHCNGQHFESIQFLCGCTIEWVPNFSGSETRRLCPKSTVIVEREARRKAMVDAIVKALKPFNPTEDELRRAKSSLADYWG